MNFTTATNVDLQTLTNALEGPYETVTTADVHKARAAAPAELWAMLGIDDAGLADGLARGIWTQS